jgi:hypothetical protein
MRFRIYFYQLTSPSPKLKSLLLTTNHSRRPGTPKDARSNSTSCRTKVHKPDCSVSVVSVEGGRVDCVAGSAEDEGVLYT